jgi:hypothetical protein
MTDDLDPVVRAIDQATEAVVVPFVVRLVPEVHGQNGVVTTLPDQALEISFDTPADAVAFLPAMAEWAKVWWLQRQMDEF